VTFNWSAGAGPSAYQLRVGATGVGASDTYSGATTTSLSTAVSGIPTNGATVYVRLLYKVAATWKVIDYTYIELPTPPAVTTPAPGSTLSGSIVTFNWSAGAGPSAYSLRVGTTGVGASDVYNGATITSLSTAVSGIPTNGATLYVRLSYKVAGTWKGIDYTYVEAGSPTPPAITNPAPGSTLSGSSVTFNWSAGAGPSAYQLRVGATGVGASDIYNGATTTSLNTAVSGIPTNGATVYVRLLYKVATTWKVIDYTYKAP
jgi:hypothetical protein